MAGAGQRLAQRAHHVRQPAGLGERMNFAAGQKNSHKKVPRSKFQVPKKLQISNAENSALNSAANL
jgi:hypothetical protein